MNASFLKSLNPEKTFALAENTELSVCQNITQKAFETYTDYLGTLTDLQICGSNAIGPLTAKTYKVADGGILHVTYNSADESLRILFDPLHGVLCNLPPKALENSPKICQPVLSVIPLDYTKQSPLDCNGMSYVLRLEDGTFVIWDGGYSADAERLYRYLSESSPLPEHQVVISAWIFTHSHLDHYGCFDAFTEKFADRVQVENFILNPLVNGEGVIRENRNDAFLTEKFPKLLRCYPNARAVRVHAGQRIEFAGAEIEILQTYEDILPEQMDWLNEASVVTRLKIAGQTALFCADCELRGDKRLILLGDALKSDFLQVAHHAFSGGTNELWDAVDPSYIFFTTSHETLLQRLLPSWRHGLYTNLFTRDSIKGVWAGDGHVKEFPLPFESDKDLQYRTI